MTTIKVLPPFTPLGNGGDKPPPLPGDGTCSSCGQGLIRMQGFTYHWPLVCDNWHCQLFKQPQRNIPKQTDDPDAPWHVKYDNCQTQKDKESENYRALIAVGVPADRATIMKSNRQTSAYLKKHYLKTKRE